MLVDGAHGPGMVDVDLGALAEAGVGYYAANCHKWICAPKGSGFLWVRPDLQAGVHPTVISHGLASPRTDRSRFRLEFDWVGTLDPTAWLCVPEALELLGSLLPGGWPELRARNRALALEARAIVCEALDVTLPCPDGLIGALATVPLEPASAVTEALIDPLAGELLAAFGIEIPVFPFPASPARALRLSAQAYNAREEYAYLAEALVELTPPRAART